MRKQLRMRWRWKQINGRNQSQRSRRQKNPTQPRLLVIKCKTVNGKNQPIFFRQGFTIDKVNKLLIAFNICVELKNSILTDIIFIKIT